MDAMTTQEMAFAAIDAVYKATRPPHTAVVSTPRGVLLFIESMGGDTGASHETLLGLPVFTRARISDAIRAAKAAGHNAFFVLA
jgi:hypothetical protein